MINTYLIFIIIALHSNNQKEKPIFDFDELVHIQLDANNDLEYINDHNVHLYSVLTSELNTENYNDLWKDLAKLKYKQRNVNSDYYSKLKRSIFIKRKCDEFYTSTCIPIFRDILIFKSQGDTLGVAKICFTCDQISFSSKAKNTDCFGQNNEFNELENILKHSK